MAIDHPPHVSSTDQQRRTEAEEDFDGKAVLKTFVWVLFGFKLATIFAIIWATQSWEMGALVGATAWPFLIVPIVALVGPVTFYMRKRRVRSRREELRRAEWMLD